MDLITSHFLAPLTAALLITTTLPLFAECAIKEYDVELGQSITVPLSPSISAHIKRAGESIKLDVHNHETITHHTGLGSDWVSEPDWGIHQIITIDVNNDGVKELLIGMGRGMVSSYYTMLAFHADGTLHDTVDVSDPEFCKTDRGFLSWYRSGPRGTDTYWAIGATGLPYRQITQTIVDEHVSHRVTYAEDGRETAQNIVLGDVNILTNSPPIKAMVGATNKSVNIYDPKDIQHPIDNLFANTPVVLLGADDTYSLFLIKYGQGKHGWIVIDDVVYD